VIGMNFIKTNGIFFTEPLIFQSHKQSDNRYERDDHGILGGIESGYFFRPHAFRQLKSKIYHQAQIDYHTQ